MAIFRKRIPPTRESLEVFAICAFPIFAWSIITVFRQIPAWTLRFTYWDLIGTIAYTQVFALFETAIVFGLLWLAAVLLPARMLRERFVAHSALIVLVAAAWFIYLQYHISIIEDRELFRLAIWAGTLLLMLLVAQVLVYRSARIRRVIEGVVDRLVVLSGIYVAVGIISIFIVIIRNV